MTGRYSYGMRRLAFAPAILLLSACHLGSAKLPPLAAHGAPLAQVPALDALDEAGEKALWADTFGDLPQPSAGRDILKKTYARDLLAGKAAQVSSVRGGGKLPGFAPAMLTDGKPETFWAAAPAARDAEVAVDLGAPTWVGLLVLEEVPELGARVREFAVEAQVGGKWRQVAAGQGIGARKVVRFERAVAASALRVRLRGDDSPALGTLSAHCAPARVAIRPDKTDFLDAATLRFLADMPEAVIRYTLDGSAPAAASPAYDPAQPPVVRRSSVIRAAAFEGAEASPFIAQEQVTAWTEAQLRPAAVFALPLERGLAYAAFDGKVESLDALRQLEPAAAGVCDGLSVPAREQAGAFVCEGWLKVESDGLYVLALDGRARVWLDGAQAVEAPAGEGARKTVGLRAGWHAVRAAWLAGPVELKCFGPGCPTDGKIAPQRWGR